MFRIGSPCRKRPHATEQSAQAEVARLSRLWPQQTFIVVPCESCAAYHVTSESYTSRKNQWHSRNYWHDLIAAARQGTLDPRLWGWLLNEVNADPRVVNKTAEVVRRIELMQPDWEHGRRLGSSRRRHGRRGGKMRGAVRAGKSLNQGVQNDADKSTTTQPSN